MYIFGSVHMFYVYIGMCVNSKSVCCPVQMVWEREVSVIVMLNTPGDCQVVCMYVCMYVCVYVCMYVCMYVFKQLFFVRNFYLSL